MVVSDAASTNNADSEPLSKEEALKRFLSRKKAAAEAREQAVDDGPPQPAGGKRKEEHGKAGGDYEVYLREYKSQRCEQAQPEHQQKQPEKEREAQQIRFPPSKRSRLGKVPGHQNTNTKEPMKRPPDMRLVTALASKGPTLSDTLSAMNRGPSSRVSMLQTLTTRDVVMIPDLFEPSSGFVMPPDPWDKGDGVPKTIYQRLVEEIHHAGKREARGGGFGGRGGGKFQDKCFSTAADGVFKEDSNGLFKAWHKTTPQAAGDGLRSGQDGNGHLIVNDRDIRWQQAQQRGEAPMYTAVRASIRACTHILLLHGATPPATCLARWLASSLRCRGHRPQVHKRIEEYQLRNINTLIGILN
jgi:hypothetical protein